MGFMKKILLLFIPVILIFAGCSQSILEPTSPVSEIEKPIISLPPNSSLQIENEFSVSGDIDGSKGGIVNMNESYYSESGRVSIRAKLKISKDSFTGTETVGYDVYSSDGSIVFFPGMAFDKDLVFDIKFTGLDLSNIKDPDEIQFLYVDALGKTYPVQYSSLNVDLGKGILEVKNALISHFSRYIWAR